MINNEKITAHLKLERSKRRVAKDGFIPFCNAFGFELARHHKVLAEALEGIIHKPAKIMLWMPPGHAKSTYASVLFPAYYMGRLPGKAVVAASHTLGLAEEFGRDGKRIINDPVYHYLMGTQLSVDSKSASRFSLTNKSKYFSCGVEGNVTGRRGNLGIADDLLSGAMASESQLIRDRVWKWLVNDFNTRLLPDASKVLIGTRWHEDDHFARILNSNDGKNWTIIKFPAIAQPNDILGRNAGDALWPEYWTLEKLLEIKNTMSDRSWNALYQQNPTAEEGDYFKSEWLQFLDDAPRDLKIYGGSDYAITANRGDYTVHIVVGHDPKTDNLYILDVWRAQEESNIWIEKFIDLCLQYKPLMWAEEGGQILKSLNPFIEKDMIKRRCFTYRKQFTSVHEKTARARSFQAHMANKKVFILNREWTDDLVLELLKFDAGKNDDQVDALGLIGRMLDEMGVITEKNKSKTHFEYDKNVLMLPGLKEIISPENTGGFRKI